MHFTDHCNPSALKPVHCFPWHVRHCTKCRTQPHTCLRTPRLSLQRQWSLYVDCSCSYYSTALDNTDISTSDKGKTPASMNGTKSYTKEQLAVEIQRLLTANAQLINDKMEIEKIKVNLETDRMRLFDEKNSLVVKREKLRAEIATLNVAGSSNALIYSR